MKADVIPGPVELYAWEQRGSFRVAAYHKPQQFRCRFRREITCGNLGLDTCGRGQVQRCLYGRSRYRLRSCRPGWQLLRAMHCARRLAAVSHRTLQELAEKTDPSDHPGIAHTPCFQKFPVPEVLQQQRLCAFTNASATCKLQQTTMACYSPAAPSCHP